MCLELKVEQFSATKLIDLYTRSCQALELVAYFTTKLNGCLFGVVDCARQDQLLVVIDRVKVLFTEAVQERSRQLRLLDLRVRHTHPATTVARQHELLELNEHANDDSYLSEEVIESMDEFVALGKVILSQQQCTLHHSVRRELDLLAAKVSVE